MTNTLEPGAGGAVAPQPVAANPLMPGQSPVPQQAQGPVGPSEMMGHFSSLQAQARARFDAVWAEERRMEAIREQLDWLVNLGDIVTTENVVEASSRIVAAGVAAQEVAGILASMPPRGGAALQAWVLEQNAQAAAMEQQLEQAVAQARYELGLTSLRTLMGLGAEEHESRRKRSAN